MAGFLFWEITLITLENISKSFSHQRGGGQQVLSNVCLALNPGEVFGLTGPSGVGKSTLLRIANLIEPPDSGRVLFGSQAVSGLPPKQTRGLRRRLGTIFQQDHLLGNQTAAQNVGLPLRLAGVDRESIARRALQCLAIVGLSEKADSFPAQLSGGERQRVGIARALAHSPSLLLADEPTAALDSRTRDEIIDCLKEINHHLGVTMLVVSHDPVVVDRLCHRRAELSQGRLLC